MHYTDLHDEGVQNEDFKTVLENAIPIFQKPFEERSKKENKLVVSLLEKVPYFNKYCYIYSHHAEEDKYLSQNLKEAKKREALKNMSQYFKFEHHTAGTAICHQGDPEEKFLFVLSGEVRRYVTRSFEDVQNELKAVRNPMAMAQAKNAESKGSRFSVEGPRLSTNSNAAASTRASLTDLPDNDSKPQNTVTSLAELIPEEREPEDEIVIEDQSKTKLEPVKGQYTITAPEEVLAFRKFQMDKKYFTAGLLAVKWSKSVLPGDYIGELSLAFNSIHSDTQVAWTDTDLVTIEKKHFEKIFDVLIRQNREKLDFVSSLLPDLPKNEITTFAYGFEEIHYKSSTVLYQEGSETNGLYLVKEGEVELFKNMSYPNLAAKHLPLLKVSPKNEKFSVLISSRGQLLGEEVLLGTAKRSFTAVTKGCNTVVYFIPKKHIQKMKLYNLQITYYLDCLAESLTQAKTSILENATKQNRFQKDFVNHVITKQIEEEKEAMGDAIREMAYNLLQAEKDAEKRSGFVRMRKPRANLGLLKENDESVKRLVELKKKSKFFDLQIDQTLMKTEVVKARQEIPKRETIQSIAKFVQNVPDGVVCREKKEYIHPLSLWENARKNHLLKHNKKVLRNHINEMANARQALTDRDEDVNVSFQNPVKNHYLHVQGLENNKRQLNLPMLENKVEFNFQKILDDVMNDGQGSPAPNEVFTRRDLRSKLLMSTERGNPTEITPICIQGLVSKQKPQNRNRSVEDLKRQKDEQQQFITEFTLEVKDSVAEEVNPLDLLFQKKLNQVGIFGDRTKYQCSNTEESSCSRPFSLPSIRPQKALKMKIPFVMPKKATTNLKGGLKGISLKIKG